MGATRRGVDGESVIMKVEADYFSLLNPQQRIALGQLLHCGSDASLRFYDAQISAVVEQYRQLRESYETTSDKEHAERELCNIRTYASKLSELLRADRPWNSWFHVLATGLLDKKPIFEPEQSGHSPLNEALVVIDCIARQAEYYIHNLDELRRPARQGRSETAGLWPLLFSIWNQNGRSMGYTENGPLHSFVALAHEVAGLNAPVPSTLKLAARSWRRTHGAAEGGK